MSRSDSSATPTFEDVVQAAGRLDGVCKTTPVMTSLTANSAAGAQVFFKCENFQKTGSFKFRGAYNAIASLLPIEQGRGVLAYSSGNHAQAIAAAGSMLGVETTILMPSDAPEVKVAATRGYGGKVVFYDRYKENREEIGARMAIEHNWALIPSYDHPQIISGQGTSAKELFEEIGPLDYLFVPLGGGGLLGGSALAARKLSPSCKIVGVEPENADDGRQSLQIGEIVHIPAPRSIADGAIVTHLGYTGFPIIRDYVSEIVTVSDRQLASCMAFFAERMKILVEPTGCLGAAAVLQGRNEIEGLKVGVILSGGNVDLTRFSLLTSEIEGQERL